jgi:hypothetical protein
MKRTEMKTFSKLSSMKNANKIRHFIVITCYLACLASLAISLGSLTIKPFSCSEGLFSSTLITSPDVPLDYGDAIVDTSVRMSEVETGSQEVPFEWDVNNLTKHCLVVEDLCRRPHMFFYRTDPTGRKHQPNVLFSLDSDELWLFKETVHRKFYRFRHLNESIATQALLDQGSTCTRSPIQNHVSRLEYVHMQIDSDVKVSVSIL